MSPRSRPLPLKPTHWGYLLHAFLECPVARSIWRNTKGPLNTSIFSSLSIEEWSKALIRPQPHLGISLKAVNEFQLSALVTMDHIWLARNKLINDEVPQITLKLINFSLNAHLFAWKDRLSSNWGLVPLMGSQKVNFNLAIRPLFAVAELLQATIIEMSLLAANLTSSLGCSALILEGDSLLWLSLPSTSPASSRTGLQLLSFRTPYNSYLFFRIELPWIFLDVQITVHTKLLNGPLPTLC
jgi:hypothetical protein